MTVFESKGRSFEGQYGESKYDFYWSPNNQILHVVDLCVGGTYSVTRSLMASPMEFVCCVKTQFENSFNFRLPQGFRLFVYGPDKYVMEWLDNNVRSIKHVDFNLIHTPYVSRKREKMKRAYVE